MPYYSLQSGYRSPYVWNKSPRQDVFREAAGFTEKNNDIQCTLASNKGHEKEFNSDSATNMELTTSRRRQYPDLINSHHDFILGYYGGSSDNVDSRAGSEEKDESQWRPPRYSKLQMPECSGVNENGICEEKKERRRYSNPDVDIMLHSGFRSPYEWNEYTGPRQDMFREAAGFTERSHDIQCTLASNKGHEKEFNSDSATNREPALQRRMKALDLVHSHHDFSDDGENSNNVDSKAGLHSEFRSPYGLDEYTGPRHDMFREAAGFTERSHDIQCTLASNKGHEKEFNSDSATNREPAMQRRMKSLDSVHSHHDFSDDDENSDNVDLKAGSEERDYSQWRPPRYSKSEGAASCGVNENGICERERERRRHSNPDENLMRRSFGTDSEDNMSEYTLQFTWPQSCPQTRRDAAGSSPREYKSMDAQGIQSSCYLAHSN